MIDLKLDTIDTSSLYTGRDPYLHMEVVINTGECKSHFGVVRGTRKQDDKTLVEVRTTTKVENVDLLLDMKDVTHLQCGFNCSASYAY